MAGDTEIAVKDLEIRAKYLLEMIAEKDNVLFLEGSNECELEREYKYLRLLPRSMRMIEK